MKLEKRKMIRIVFSLIIMVLFSRHAFVQTGQDYIDDRGKKVHFPLGKLSFADEVISFEKGNPSSADKYSDPEQALGPPDYLNDDQEPPGYVTLGCGGTCIFRFVDNILIDVDGPDLYVFEIGPDVEPTELAISKDGEDWVEIGKIAGGTAEIDIAQMIDPGECFQYIRLTDLQSACGGAYPGADIDAVGAIGSAVQITLKTSVLFDFDRYTLKTEAQEELNAVAERIFQYPDARVIIEGHTDNIGSTTYNQTLSKNRAGSVRDYLLSIENLKGLNVEIIGHGMSRPISSNDTEEGREKNRRVEIIIIP